MKTVQDLLLQIKAVSDFSDVQKNVSTLRRAMEELKMPKGLRDSASDIFDELEKETKKYQKAIDKGFKTKGDITGLEKTGNRITALFARLQKEIETVPKDELSKIIKLDPSIVKNTEDQIKNIKKQLETFLQTGQGKNSFDQIKQGLDFLEKVKTKGSSPLTEAFKVKINQGDLKGALEAFEKIKNYQTKLGKNSENSKNWANGVNLITKAYASLGSNPTYQNLTTNLETTQNILNNLKTAEVEKLAQTYGSLGFTIENVTNGHKKLHKEQTEASEAALTFSKTLDHFKNRAAYFFGIANSIQLFKRAVRDAYQSVKELDKVMTETAVVTDFTVGDMWEQLPEYSKRASELGVSIKGAYESATLYYQQGLKTNEVIAASSETLKMARIAGMDYAEATNYMTAALRGFNMEINEQSAQRVNDVYSELAAITASDTEEISKAMTKTASIADSANMEFETTAAFLAQIIETTREAPETAGTALKTVIARFQELKKDPAEIGEVEGEIVDANKIETALRTIDVALRDTQGQFRDLDDVFLEIASKWDTLDLNTQRYIATMAAGSRQQSRFIAMMSDYSRTMELVNAANNSAGASQEQFEKTLDSLESKVARLDNAWTNFTMGIANSSLIKVGVDGIYALIEGINKLTDIFPGPISGAAKLGVAFAGLKGGEAALRVLWKSMEEGGGPITGLQIALGKAVKGMRTLGTEAFWLGEAPINKVAKSLSKVNLAIAQTGYAGVSGAEAIKTLASAYSISTNEASRALELTLLGVSADNAAALAKEGLSKDTLEKIALSKLSAGYTKKEAQAAYEEAAAEIIASKGIQVNTASKKEGILLSIKSKASKAKESIQNVLLGKTAESAAVGQTALNTSLEKFITVTGPSIAMFAALAGLFVYAIKHSPEAMFEKAQKATERADEAAKEAKTSYDNLLSGQKEYTELQNSLDNLTKGTKEWEQALFEANQQVLNLLKNYEGLKVQAGENGRLEITNWEEINKELKEYVNTTQMAVSAASIREKQLASDLVAPLSNRAPLDPTIANAVSNRYSETEKGYLDDWLYSGKIYNVKEAYDKLERGEWSIEDFHLITDFEDTFSKGKNSIESFIKKLEEYSNAQQELSNTVQTVSASLLTTLSPKEREADSSSIVAEAVAQFGVDNNKQLWTEAYNQYAWNFEPALRRAYKDVYGTEADESFGAEELRAALAEADVGKKLEETTKELINFTENAGSEKGDILGYLSGGGTLRKGDRLSLSDDTIQQLAEKLGKKVEEIEEEIKTTNENIDSSFFEARRTAIENVGGLNSIRAKEIYEASSLLEGSTFDQYKGYLNNLVLLMGRAAAEGGEQAGLEAGQYFNNQLEKLLNENSENKDKILNAFSRADLTTTTGIKGFIEGLKEIGVEIPKEDMDGFISKLIDLSNAVNNIDLGTLLDQTKSLRDLADDIKDREISEGISQEEYDQIINSGAVDENAFYYTGQEYIYLGDSMNALANVIIEATDKLLNGSINAIKGRIASGEAANTALESGAIDNLTETERETFLAGEIDTAAYSKVIKRFLKEYYALQGIIKDVEAMDPADTIAAYKQAMLDNKDKIELQGQLADKEQRAIETELYTMSAVEMEISGYDPELINNAKKVKITNEELDATFVRLKKEFEKTGKSANEYDGVLIDLASNAKKNSAAQRALGDALADNKEALAHPGTAEYDEALQEVTSAAKKYFGEEMGVDFVSQYLSDFIDLLKGGSTTEEALKRIGEAWREKIIEGLGKDGKDITTIANALIEEIPAGTSFHVIGDFNPNKIVEGMNFTIEQAKQVQAVLNSMGWNASFGLNSAYLGSDGSLLKENDPKATSSFFEQQAKKGITYKKINQTDWTLEKQNPLDFSGIKTSGSTSKWENPYDKQYNTLEKINEAERERNKLEKELQLLQSRGEATGQDYINTYKQIYANLEQQLALQKKLREGRLQELKDLLAINAAYQKYAAYDFATGTISINWAELNKVKSTDTKTGEAIEKYISELERITGAIEDVEDQILEIEQNQEELKQEALDAYVSLEERTISALEKIRQDEIETMQEGFDSLTEAEEELADAISKSIDEMRQARENEKTEDEIAEKERRLAYLRQDTTGSNALEIKRLEQEIADQRESYQDALIDQALNNLQEQNEEASAQREKQIELMEAQLEHDMETGAIAAEATRLVEDALRDGVLTKDDKLYTILSDAEGWPAKTHNMLQQILAELQEQFGKAAALGALGNAEVMSNTDYMELMIQAYRDAGNRVDDEVIRLNDLRNEKINDPSYTGSQPPVASTESAIEAAIQKAEQNYDYSGKMIELYKASGGKITPEIERLNERRNQKVRDPLYGGSKTGDVWSIEDLKAWLEAKTGIPAYNTGGLADFTGPAWLDGTKSKPELVLNARDTQNFIMLKDILSGILTNATPSKSSGGDNYFDIDINVEEISNDYDVDRMAERIKQNIYEDSTYRNVNAVNFLR